MRKPVGVGGTQLVLLHSCGPAVHTRVRHRHAMADEAETYFNSLSPAWRDELRLLALNDKAKFTEILKGEGLAKMGLRLKVELLLQEPGATSVDVSDEAPSISMESGCAVSDTGIPPEPETQVAESSTAESSTSSSAPSSGNSSNFIASATFAGRRPGFVFKMDSKGVGYYRDASNPDAKLKGKMLGNMSWLSEEAEAEAEAAKPKAAAKPKPAPPSPAAVTTLSLPGAAPRAPPEPGRLSKERKALLEKQAGPFAPDLKEGKYAEKGEIVLVNSKRWAFVKDIKCGSYEVLFFDEQGFMNGTTCHFSELQTTQLSMNRWLMAKKKWEARAPLARKSLTDDRRGHVHKSWTGPSITELRLTHNSQRPGKGYYAGVVPSVPVLMPPKIDPAEVKKEGVEEEEPAAKEASAPTKSGYYYAHRRKIDFKVPTPAPTPIG